MSWPWDTWPVLIMTIMVMYARRLHWYIRSHYSDLMYQSKLASIRNHFTA